LKLASKANLSPYNTKISFLVLFVVKENDISWVKKLKVGEIN